MKNTAIFVLLFLNTILYGQVEQKYVRRGNNEYEAEKYREAEIYFRRALEKNPESAKANFNLGNTMYRQDQYEAAAARYDNLLKQTENHTELSRYYYNLGNTFFKSGKLEESISAYKNALLNNPADLDAKHNLQLALRMLQKKDQSENADQENNQNDQQKQDQQRNQQNKQNQQQDQQNGENQDQMNNNQDRQNQDNMEAPEPQPARGQISPEDAERLLQALENEEKNVIKKVEEQQQQERLRQVPVEKNW